MKEVAIIEFASHLVYLDLMVSSVKSLGFHPVLFISEEVKKSLLSDSSLSALGAEVVTINLLDSETVFAARKKINRCSLILINTLTSRVFYLVSERDFNRCIVTVHNAVSETLWPNPLSVPSLFRRLERVSSSLRILLLSRAVLPLVSIYSDYALKRHGLLTRAHKVFVFHQNMIQVITKKLDISTEKVRQVPFNLPRVDQEMLPPPDSPKSLGFLGLTIIGIISFKRKNFKDLLCWASKINDEFPVRLSIIGSYDSELDRKQLLRLINVSGLSVSIVGGEKWASNSEIKRTIKQTHLLLGAHAEYVRIGFEKEFYGFTKASGAEYDACSYNRLLLRPSEIPATQGMENVSIAYREEQGFRAEISDFLRCESYYSKYKKFGSAREKVLAHLQEKMLFALSPELSYPFEGLR